MRVSRDERARGLTVSRGSFRVPGRMGILPVPVARRCAGPAVILGLALLAAPVLAGPPMPSVIPNSGFEKPHMVGEVSDGTPEGWTKGTKETGSLARDVRHEGNNSLQVSCSSTANGRWISSWAQDRQILKPGVQVTAAVWVKCAPGGDRLIPTVRIEFQDKDGATLPGGVSPDVLPESSWQVLSTPVTVPPKAAMARVVLELEGQGKAWFDDVWVGIGPPPGTGLQVWLLAKLAAMIAMVIAIAWVASGYVRGRRAQTEAATTHVADLRLPTRGRDTAQADVGRQQFGIDPEVAELARQVRELSEGATRMNKAVATWEWMREPASIESLGRAELAGREAARFALFTGDKGAWARVASNPDAAHGVFRQAFAACVREVTEAGKGRWGSLLAKYRERTAGLDAGVVDARARVPMAEDRVQRVEQRAAKWAEHDQGLDAACRTLVGVAAGARTLAPATSAAEASAPTASRPAREDGEPSRWLPGAPEKDAEQWRGDVEARLQRLRKTAPAAPAQPPAEVTCPSLEARLPALVDRVEDVAYVVSTKGYRVRHDEFVKLGDDLRTTVLPLLDAPEEDEAARHYHGALQELLDLFDGRLKRALQSVQDAKGGEGLRDATGVDLRVERLRARAEGLSSATDAYLADLAKPSVQQYLRPLITSLVRDFLSPLLEEAGPAGESGGSVLPAVEKKVRDVLRLTIHLEPVEPEVGQRVDDDRHEVIQVVDRTPGAVSGTVAAVVQPGYLWADEVIARARVRSYR